MSKIVSIAKEQINSCIINAAKSAISKGVLPEAELTPFIIEVPSNRDHGDYAVNAAMVWSRVFRNAPR
ncbi:MAG: arginine--tRNA ligase, partial [Clostridia bacterium]|nr:arginine--tRNA ligase [Clostridia bacterium]